MNPANLKDMNKSFNTMRGGFEKALANLRRHRIRVYGTFIFGYDRDTPEMFCRDGAFAREHALTSRRSIISRRFRALRFTSGCRMKADCFTNSWWLDERYSYNRFHFSRAA